MVKWVCQIVTPVRHRALIFDVRLFAGNAADDALVTYGTFRFCRLVCLYVKRRNIILNGKRHSLLNSALFRADSHTVQKTISPFSLALILTFDFAALSEHRSCPEDRSRRFVPVGTLRRHKLHIARFRVKHESSFISLLLLFPQKPSLLWEPCDAVMAVTSLGDISRSDGHVIFKVQVRLQDHFSEKYSPLPYIQEVGKRAEKCKFPRLWTRTEKDRKLKGGHRYVAKAHHSGTAQRPARGARSDAGTAICGNRHLKIRAGKIRSRRFQGHQPVQHGGTGKVLRRVHRLPAGADRTKKSPKHRAGRSAFG